MNLAKKKKPTFFLASWQSYIQYVCTFFFFLFFKISEHAVSLNLAIKRDECFAFPLLQCSGKIGLFPSFSHSYHNELLLAKSKQNTYVFKWIKICLFYNLTDCPLCN